ncbi:hypothetical protein C6499_19045, partial [Candidatus Poribacteria bacterium]
MLTIADDVKMSREIYGRRARGIMDYFTLLTLTPRRSEREFSTFGASEREFPTLKEFSDENTQIFWQDQIKVLCRDKEGNYTDYCFEEETANRTDQQNSQVAFDNWVKTNLPITAAPRLTLIEAIDLYRTQTGDEFLTPSIARACPSIKGRVKMDEPKRDRPPQPWGTENASRRGARQNTD